MAWLRGLRHRWGSGRQPMEPACPGCQSRAPARTPPRASASRRPCTDPRRRWRGGGSAVRRPCMPWSQPPRGAGPARANLGAPARRWRTPAARSFWQGRRTMLKNWHAFPGACRGTARGICMLYARLRYGLPAPEQQPPDSAKPHRLTAPEMTPDPVPPRLPVLVHAAASIAGTARLRESPAAFAIAPAACVRAGVLTPSARTHASSPRKSPAAMRLDAGEIGARARRRPPRSEVIRLITPRARRARVLAVLPRASSTRTRIDGGPAFLAHQHADTPERAERETGVPAEVIVAIIGVETIYGPQHRQLRDPLHARHAGLRLPAARRTLPPRTRGSSCSREQGRDPRAITDPSLARFRLPAVPAEQHARLCGRLRRQRRYRLRR